MKFVSNQPLGGSFLSPGLCSGLHTAPDRAPERRKSWWGRHQGMAVHEQLWKSRNGLIIQISLHFFFGCRSQGGALVRRCCGRDGAGKGREQKAADGSREMLLHPWRISLESLALAGGCVLKARGWESCSLCLFPFNHTSVCNLRQAGEEKRGRKKKRKGKIAQLFPPLPPPLSPPRPARSHVTVTQRWLRGSSAWRALRETNSNFQPKAETGRPWAGRARIHPGGKVNKGDIQPGRGKASAATGQGRLNFVLREGRALCSGKKAKLSPRRPFIQPRLDGEKLPAHSLHPRGVPRHHEHLPHPGGCLPLAGHHYSPAEDCEVQVLCW